MDEFAIKIEHVSKEYRLGAIGGGSLKSDLQTWWAGKRGKEDPNSLIGQRTDVKIGERFLALDDINLEVKKGEALGIIGHNGAGKSTLLKLLSRVTAPTKGTIGLNGRVASMLEVGTGFHGELTGRENIYMNGAILGMTKKEIDAKLEDIIEFSECRQFIDTPVKRYSSGMYVKLAFSVAAHLDSEIMIMDEVLAVGDMAFQKKCLTKMREAADKEGRTVLYVSHNMNTIRQLCDRVVVLDHGKVTFDGEVEEGIGNYMNIGSSMLKCTYCFDGQRRSIADRGTKVFLHGFTFLEHNVARFFSSEKMAFLIDVEGHETVKELRVRLEVRTPDNTNVGMSESGPLFSIQKGQRKKFGFEYDISNLAEGFYTLRLTLFHLNEYCVHYGYDETTEAICFEVIDSDNNRTIWMPQYWGRVKLPAVTALDWGNAE